MPLSVCVSGVHGMTVRMIWMKMLGRVGTVGKGIG